MIQILAMFPDERSATLWFELHCRSEGRRYGHCGRARTGGVPNAVPMSYWCSDCRSHFSVRAGTPLAHFRFSLRQWVLAIYLCATGIKGLSGMQFHRDIDVTPRTAGFMLQRLRKARDASGPRARRSAQLGSRQTHRSGLVKPLM